MPHAACCPCSLLGRGGAAEAAAAAVPAPSAAAAEVAAAAVSAAGAADEGAAAAASEAEAAAAASFDQGAGLECAGAAAAAATEFELQLPEELLPGDRLRVTLPAAAVKQFRTELDRLKNQGGWAGGHRCQPASSCFVAVQDAWGAGLLCRQACARLNVAATLLLPRRRGCGGVYRTRGGRRAAHQRRRKPKPSAGVGVLLRPPAPAPQSSRRRHPPAGGRPRQQQRRAGGATQGHKVSICRGRGLLQVCVACLPAAPTPAPDCAYLAARAYLAAYSLLLTSCVARPAASACACCCTGHPVVQLSCLVDIAFEHYASCHSSWPLRCCAGVESNGAGKTALTMAPLWALTGSMDSRAEVRLPAGPACRGGCLHACGLLLVAVCRTLPCHCLPLMPCLCG